MNLFCNTLKQVSELTMILSESTLINDHDKLALYALTKNNETWLKYVNMTLNDAKTAYENNALIVKPIDENGTVVQETLTAATTLAFDAIVPELHKIMEMTFVGSWESLLHYKGKSEIDNKIAAAIQKWKTQKAMEQTAMEIDTEPAADPKTLKNIVKSEVATSNKTLERRLHRLEQNLHRNGTPKNSQWGANIDNGALSKKKSEKKNNTPRSVPKKHNNMNNTQNNTQNNAKQKQQQQTPTKQ